MNKFNFMNFKVGVWGSKLVGSKVGGAHIIWLQSGWGSNHLAPKWVGLTSFGSKVVGLKFKQ